jgi:plastocyanin
MKKILIFGLLVIVIAVLISGCTTTTTTQPATPTPTATPMPTETPTTTATPTPTATISVDIKGFTFVPVTITVPAGTTVTWTNDDTVAHTVTSVTGAFDSGNIDPGKTYSFTFNQAGTFEYSCTNHPSIPHGTVTVTQ